MKRQHSETSTLNKRRKYREAKGNGRAIVDLDSGLWSPLLESKMSTKRTEKEVNDFIEKLVLLDFHFREFYGIERDLILDTLHKKLAATYLNSIGLDIKPWIVLLGRIYSDNTIRIPPFFYFLSLSRSNLLMFLDREFSPELIDLTLFNVDKEIMLSGIKLSRSNMIMSSVLVRSVDKSLGFDEDFILGTMEYCDDILRIASKQILKNKSVIMALAAKGHRVLGYLPLSMKEKDIVLACLKYHPSDLYMVPCDLRDDIEIGISAIRAMKDMIDIALRNDIEIGISSISYVKNMIDEFGISIAKPMLYNDVLKSFEYGLVHNSEVAEVVLSEDGASLQFFGKGIRSDERLVKIAVSNNPFALSFASETIQNNLSVVMQAVTKDGKCLKYASFNLCDNKELVEIAIKNYPKSILYASQRLRNDPELVKMAVLGFPMLDSLLHSNFLGESKWSGVSGDLSSLVYINTYQGTNHHLRTYQGMGIMCMDIEFLVLKCARLDSQIFIFASDRLKQDKEFILKLIEISPKSFCHIHESLKTDRDFALRVLKTHPLCLEYFDYSLRDDYEIVKQAVRLDSRSLQYASERLTKDVGIISCIIDPPFDIRYAHQDLKNDYEFIKQAVSSSGVNLEYASEELKKDRTIVDCAIMNSVKSIEYVDEEFLGCIDLACLVYKENPRLVRKFHDILENFTIMNINGVVKAFANNANEGKLL